MMKNTGRGGGPQRTTYLIDRFPVTVEFGGGWKCGCADFASSNGCRHTREAAGRRAAQERITAQLAEASTRRRIR
jgi:hypothetical protein